jgi:hypothetical protein
LFEAGQKRGDIPADVELEPVITMLMLIADGVWWQRALQKDFDAKAVLPLFMDIIRHMLRAKPTAAGHKKEERAR